MGYYEQNRALDELLRKEEEKRRKSAVSSTNIDMESSFSPNTKIGGIMGTWKPKFGSIDQIKDAQVAQRKLIHDMEKKQWNELSTGTDEIQIINTQNVENAKKGLVDLDFELTTAYGLGPNGYLSKAKELDNEVMSYEPKTSSQNTVLPQTTTDYSAPKSNYEADDWVMHGKQPQQVPKKKPITTVQPYDPTTSENLSYYSNDRDDLSKAPQWAKEMQIAQKQDEIVHNPNIGVDAKDKMYEDLRKLNAEKNVIVWKQYNPNPTEKDYNAKKNSFDEQINLAADDYLNSYGGRDDEETKDAWVEYGKTVDGLVAQKNAFNRALMGVETSGVRATAEDEAKNRELDYWVHHEPTDNRKLDDIVNLYGNRPLIDSSGELDLEQVKDLMKSIGEYKLDQIDPYMNEDEFAQKYHDGEMLKIWTSELRELIGEEYFNEYISVYDDWEIPEKIDTPEEMIAAQAAAENDDSQNTSEVSNRAPLMPISAYQWLDNDLSSNPEYFPLIKGYYDYIKLEGGKEAVLEYLYGYQEIPSWYTDVNIAQDFARFELTGTVKPIEKKLNEQEDSIWDTLDDEYVSIYPEDEDEDLILIESALDVIANGEQIADLVDANAISQIIIDGIKNGDGFTNIDNPATAFPHNSTYVEKIDGTRVEMEVLTAAQTRRYGGDGIQGQEDLENAAKLLTLFYDQPETVLEVGDVIAEELLEYVIEGLIENYKLGKMLQEGDVRVSFKPELMQGFNYKFNYFFRDGQLMFVTVLDGVIWVNEEFIKENLMEVEE